MVPSGAPTNALQTEQLPYIVAVKLYSEPEGARAEVGIASLTWLFVCVQLSQVRTTLERA